MPLLYLFFILRDTFMSVSWLIKIPLCGEARALKLISVFMYSLNTWVILVIKCGWNILIIILMRYSLMYILQSILVLPLLELHIIFWWIKLYPILLVYLIFTECNLGIWWKLQYRVNIFCIKDKDKSCIDWMPSRGLWYWYIPLNNNIMIVLDNTLTY